MDAIAFRNSYLTPGWLFPMVIGHSQFERALLGEPAPKLQHALEKLWFWPRISDVEQWTNGKRNYQAYAKVDDDARLLLEWVKKLAPHPRSVILDLGCNCGRHIKALAADGYTQLIGVDANSSALANISRGICQNGNVTLWCDLIQRYLSKARDRSVLMTYSHGQTIELIHPSFDVVKHLCRITRNYIVLILLENDGYRRNWLTQFKKHGFNIHYLQRPIRPGDGASLIVLERDMARP